MIVLCSDLSGLSPETAVLMNIFCLHSAFKGSVLETDMWVQTEGEEVTAVIARYGGRLYIHSKGVNTEEIKNFIETIGFEEIFCEKETAEALKLSVLSEFVTLSAKSANVSSFKSDISLKALYEGLSYGSDGKIELPDFDVFAPDVSHRLRHDGAKAFLGEGSAALVFVCAQGGILNGISVKKEFRQKGEGSRLLNLIKDSVNRELFVCCDEKIKEFYIKNGFSQKGRVVIAR